MTALCTADDLRLALSTAELAQLSDDVGGVLESTEILERSIEAGSAEVLANVAAVATLPLATVPVLLQDLAVRCALYWLFLRRGKGEQRKEDYALARETLGLIRQGKIPLWDAEDDDSQAEGGFSMEAI